MHPRLGIALAYPGVSKRFKTYAVPRQSLDPARRNPEPKYRLSPPSLQSDVGYLVHGQYVKGVVSFFAGSRTAAGGAGPSPLDAQQAHVDEAAAAPGPNRQDVPPP